MVRHAAQTACITFLGLVLAGCGSLDHHELAPGLFNVWGDGLYARDAELQQEAARVCPMGYTKLWEDAGPGTAEVEHSLLWRIMCNEGPQ